MDRLRDWLAALGGRLRALPAGRLAKAGALIFGVTLATLWLTFPVDAALENARRRIGGGAVNLEFGSARMGLIGPVMHDVRIDGRVNMRLDRLAVRPRASTLWLNPGVHAEGELGDGWLWVESGTGNAFDVAFAADALDVLRSGLGAALPMGLNLSGLLSAEGGFYWSENPEEITGEVRVAIERPRLFSELMPLPTTEISFQAMKLVMTAANGVVTIAPLSLDGEEVWGTLRGEIELNRNLMLSKANLRIQLYFNQTLDAAVSTLLPLAGFRKEKDAYVRQYNGPLGRIRG